MKFSLPLFESSLSHEQTSTEIFENDASSQGHDSQEPPKKVTKSNSGFIGRKKYSLQEKKDFAKLIAEYKINYEKECQQTVYNPKTKKLQQLKPRGGYLSCSIKPVETSCRIGIPMISKYISKILLLLHMF